LLPHAIRVVQIPLAGKRGAGSCEAPSPSRSKPAKPFYEGPNDVHIVGRNAIDCKPAKFVVFLVKNQGVPAFIPTK